MHSLLLILYLFFFYNGQTDPINRPNIEKNSIEFKINGNVISDTLGIKESDIEKKYMLLYEKMLEQKQQHYDSSLDTLNLWASIFGASIGIITLLFVILSFIGFSRIKDIGISIEEKLEDSVKRIITDKYEPDITAINHRLSQLEEIPNPVGPIEKKSDNPFDKKQ